MAEAKQRKAVGEEHCHSGALTLQLPTEPAVDCPSIISAR